MTNNGRKCAVIGYGSWATAIVKILTENGVRVGRSEEHTSELQSPA